MIDYKIVCTDQVPINEPNQHAHIVAVGVDANNDGYANDKHTKEKVINNIEEIIARYYTVGPMTNKIAYVEVVQCDWCNEKIIKSEPDATTDNNLDSLRRCDWNR